MIVFVPSYGFLEKIMECWSNHHRKFHKPVFYESSNSNSSSGNNNNEYPSSAFSLYCQKAITKEGAILVSVIGGRLSEGINFSDELGRMIIIIGMPFPNIQDPELQERIKYHLERNNDNNNNNNNNNKKREQNEKEKDEKEVGGYNYLENICMRSINQTIGK